MNVTLRYLLRAPSYLYRWHCGWLLGRRFMLLIHVGRRTGRAHRTVLEIMQYRDETDEMIVMSGFGRDADWLRNIAATPNVEVVVGSRRFIATHRTLGADEAMRALAGYEQRHRLFAPLIRMVLSRLLGWRYDGSRQAQHRVVNQLPFIAFRPDAHRRGDPAG